jgi:hypothetical protein
MMAASIFEDSGPINVPYFLRKIALNHNSSLRPLQSTRTKVLTFAQVATKPVVLQTLTGLSHQAFLDLLPPFQQADAHLQHQAEQLRPTPRKRQPGSCTCRGLCSWLEPTDTDDREGIGADIGVATGWNRASIVDDQPMT